MADGSADAAFLVPAGFSAAIDAGQAVTLEVVGARDAGLATEIARSVAQRFGDGVVTVQLAVATAAELRGPGGLGAGRNPDAALQAGSSGRPRPPGPRRSRWSDRAALRQLSLASYFSRVDGDPVPVLLGADRAWSACSTSGARARSRGSWPGRSQPWTVLVGKLLGGFVQGMLAMTVLVVATTLPHRRRLGLAAGRGRWSCAAAVIAAIGISTLVMSFSELGRGRRRRQLGRRDHAGRPRRHASRPPPRPPRSMAHARAVHPARLVHARPRRHAGRRDASPTACRRSAVLLAIGLVTGAHRHRPRAAPGDGPMSQLRQGPRDRAGQPAPPGPRPGRPVLRVRPAHDHHRGAGPPVRRHRAGAAGRRRAGRRRRPPRRSSRSSREDTARFEIRRVADEATLRTQVERGQLEAGLVIPDGFTPSLGWPGHGRGPVPRHDRLRSRSGSAAPIDAVGRPAGARSPRPHESRWREGRRRSAEAAAAADGGATTTVPGVDGRR